MNSVSDYRQTTVTSKPFNVLLNPLQCEPLILESKVPVYLWLIACKKTKHRKTISDIYPDF